MANRKRNIKVEFWVTEEELSLIDSRKNELGFHDRSSYVRKVAIDTYVLELDLKPFTKVANAIDKIGVNINQIAHIANSDKSVNQISVNHLLEIYDDLKKETTIMYRKLLKAKQPDWWNEDE